MYKFRQHDSLMSRMLNIVGPACCASPAILLLSGQKA